MPHGAATARRQFTEFHQNEMGGAFEKWRRAVAAPFLSCTEGLAERVEMTERVFEQIALQVGLNTLKYQEIERNIKKLIKQTSQGFVVDFAKQLDIHVRENAVSLNKITLGNLLHKLDEAKQDGIMPDTTAPAAETLNMSYHVPPLAASEEAEWAAQFEQIVAARNRLIHDFELYYGHEPQAQIVQRLRDEFVAAEAFNQKIVQRLNEVTVQGLNTMIRGLEWYRANLAVISAARAFWQVYAGCVREDGWAVWTLVLSKMREQHGETLAALQAEYPQQNITEIVKRVYPNWRFSQEPTPKGSVRVLVQVE